MKTILSLSTSLLLFFIGACAQNVGIGNPDPAEKLDVSGNINFTGQLKSAGAQGTAGQVFMKDNNNLPVWGNICSYKNIKMYDCNGIANSAGASNCFASFLVPAGVTELYVEVWGGGGGGGSLSSGGSGAYCAGKFFVTPGAELALLIGARGVYGTTTVSGIIGGNSEATYAGLTLQATGGEGGISGNYTGSFSLGTPTPATFSSNLANYIGFRGFAGNKTVVTYMQRSSTDYATRYDFADGADAVGFPGTGGRGGSQLVATGLSQIHPAALPEGGPGAGGGAGNIGGSNGSGGRILIHY